MKVVVLGGTGMTGRCAVYDLLANDKIEEIVVGDIAKNVEFNDKRVKFVKVDANDHEHLVRVLKGNDIVINAIQYNYNLNIMKAALEAKTHYLDLGGLYYVTLEQMKLDEEFKNQGLLAIIGMGAQPGVTNILASYAATKFDKIDEIIIRDGWADKTNYSKLFFTWSPTTLFDELTLNAVHYDNGIVKSEPFPFIEFFDFGGEVGKVPLFRSIHSEIATIPSSFAEKGVKYVEWREGGADIDKLKFLSDIGFGKNEKIIVDGKEIVGRDFLFHFLKAQGLLYPPENVQVKDYEVTVVEVKGLDAGKKRRMKVFCYFKFDENWKVAASQKEVGVPASIVAQMMLSGVVKGMGVKPPEQIVPFKQFFAELAKRDIKIRVESEYDLV